jgi:transcriptional regulator with PAS, ATPase and Fis domain
VLRVLQEREFERVGGRTPISVDVRVISATNMELEKAIAEGRFRSDLYYRLNVVTAQVPPVRERRSDIPALVKFFLERASRAEGKSIAGLGKEAWDLLMAYAWPGNVRELQNVIEQAVVMCDGERITSEHLPVELRRAAAGAGSSSSVPGPLGMEEAVGPLERILERTEEAAIRAALERLGGNKSRTAAELGIARVTLYAKMKKHGIA